jgi:chromosome partitioning protein
VALLDTDPQGSLTDWWNEREADTPVLLKLNASLSETVAAAAAAGFSYLIIDTPPAISETITTVIGVADLVIVPITPSPHDLRAAGRTVDLIEERKKPLLFVLNNANQRARITVDAVTALSEHGPVAKTILHQRTDFRTSMIKGKVVSELAPGKAGAPNPSAIEVSALWSFVHTRMNGKQRNHAAP